jgi:hypothetical protein
MASFELGNPSARSLQLCPQRERGAVVFLQRDKPHQSVRFEGRAGISLDPLDQSLRRIADVLGCITDSGR